MSTLAIWSRVVYSLAMSFSVAHMHFIVQRNLWGGPKK